MGWPTFLFLFAAALVILTFLGTKILYDLSVIRSSRELEIHVGGASQTFKSPFDNKRILKQFRALLNDAILQAPPQLKDPGIEVETYIWICRNGKRDGRQNTVPLYLRQVSSNQFQFWRTNAWKGGLNYLPMQPAAGNLDASIKYYWQEHLSDLLRDFNLDWEAAHPFRQERRSE